jgi:hypothetical protein
MAIPYFLLPCHQASPSAVWLCGAVPDHGARMSARRQDRNCRN